MPYKTNAELPDLVKSVLPDHGQNIYRKTFNKAWEEYKDPKKRRTSDDRETISHKVAWSAVKQEYEKNEKTGKWEKKEK